jgi:signal transduction histidine kinase
LAEQFVPAELDDLKKALAELASELAEASTELRELSRGLHPAILSQGGLSSALTTLACRSTIPVTLDAAIAQKRCSGTYLQLSRIALSARKPVFRPIVGEPENASRF